MISGTRKPPPISTSSPRDTTTVAAACQRGEREQHRGGVVVHDQPGLGAARAREQRAGVVVARAAPPGRQVELEVRVRAADACGVGQRVGGERRAAEVGVQQHAGRVHDGAEPGALQPLDPARRVTDDGFLVDVAAGRDRHPGVRDRVAAQHRRAARGGGR